MRTTAALLIGCLSAATLTASGVRARPRLSQPGLARATETTAPVFKQVEGDSLSVAGGLIHNLFEDSRHNLWVMSDDGLSRYDRASETFERFVPDPK